MALNETLEGTLTGVGRFPVKSMRHEELEEAYVQQHGIMGDRVYAFQASMPTAFTPWFTGRDAPEMLLLRAEVIDYRAFSVSVELPDSSKMSIHDPALKGYLASKALRRGMTAEQLTLVFSPTGIMDAFPISLLSMQTVSSLEGEIEAANPNFQLDMSEIAISEHAQEPAVLDKNRFRPNFYVSWQNERPFYEDELVGRKLKIGADVVIAIRERDVRCTMITLDPETAERTPLVQTVVAKQHGNCTGVYATVERTGLVRLNDPVYLLPG